MRPTDEQLTRCLRDWLPTRRWFAAKSQDSVGCSIADRRELPVSGAELLIVAVAGSDGEHRYQVPVRVSARSGPGLIAALPDGYLHDGLADHEVVDAILHWPHRANWLIPPLHARDTVPLSAEQSNTSLIYDRALVKFYRRLGAGGTSEVETLLGLSGVGCSCVPPLWAWLQDPAIGSLGMVSPLLRDAVDGGRMAAGYADALADFSGPARDLGRTLRVLHRDMRAAFGTQTWSEPEVARRTERMRERLDRAVALMPSLAFAVPRLLEHLSHLQGPMQVQRVHGDLHLGQTLRQENMWLIIDFEGEPGGGTDNVDHWVRDLAGVVRSFDYVARLRSPGPQGAAWRDTCVAAFLDGYGAVADGSLLLAYLIDKAAYEVAYEAQNRPELVELPTAALVELAGRL